jgi:hypothetical protein
MQRGSGQLEWAARMERVSSEARGGLRPSGSRVGRFTDRIEVRVKDELRRRRSGEPAAPRPTRRRRTTIQDDRRR